MQKRLFYLNEQSQGGKLYTFIIQYWWVVLFLITCSILYEKAMRTHKDHYEKLTTQFISLEKEKERVLLRQNDLQNQINSQSDPAWIELLLIRGLGVAPENQQKVYFSPEMNDESD